MLEKPRREGNPPTQLLRAAIKRATEEASKTKTRATIPSSNPTPRRTCGKIHLSKTHRHPNFYCKTIDNSQGMQASKLSIHTPMNTEGMLHSYNGLFTQPLKKKNEIMSPAVTWMDLEMITLSKSDRKRQISYDITNRQYRKMDTTEII